MVLSQISANVRQQQHLPWLQMVLNNPCKILLHALTFCLLLASSEVPCYTSFKGMRFPFALNFEPG